MGIVIEGINWGQRTFTPGHVNYETPIESAFKQEVVSRAPDTPREPEKPKKETVILTALPGDPMPEGYPDYRPLLQRDGLFVYAWAVWKKEGRIKVIWFRSTGPMRKFASAYCGEQELAVVTPAGRADCCRGSAWSWDEENPDYAVFATPRYIDSYDRPAFLVKLRETGVTVNLDYEFTLKKQKAGVIEQLQPVPVIDRFTELTYGIMSHPSTAIDQIENFVGAIIADGTVDRWGKPLPPKAAIRKQRRERKALMKLEGCLTKK